LNHAIIWHEANCLANIPKHPNIVRFDSLVVDAVEGGEDVVVGFTTKFIPGGTVEDNVSRVFKLKYLKQLIAVCSCYYLVPIFTGYLLTWYSFIFLFSFRPSTSST
jgi:hypothetical protein